MLKKRTDVDAILESLIPYAGREYAGESLLLFQRFCQHYCSHMAIADLRSKPAETLFRIFSSHLQLMLMRSPHELKIRVFNPTDRDDGWHSGYTVIQLATDNMPFLVDTVRMTLQQMKITTHLMMFSGGLSVTRDVNGYLKEVAEYDMQTPDSSHEAPVYLEVDMQTDSVVLERICKKLVRALSDVRAAVTDWQPMRAALQECATALLNPPAQLDPSAASESAAFLQWMLDDHFTFLGCRDYVVEGEGVSSALELVQGKGLGVLRDEAGSKLVRAYANLPEAARKIALNKNQILMVSKTNTFSTVHRPAYTDYVAVKRFNSAGCVIGERRFIGLYTSEAYRMSPTQIPLVRQKVASIIDRAHLPPASHAGKELIHILKNFPRDDLFHADVDTLYELTTGILQLHERRCTRVFLRHDAFGRFISTLVFLPLDTLNSDLLVQVAALLKETFNAVDITHNTTVTESSLSQVHFVVRVNPRKPLHYSHAELEKKIEQLTCSWVDILSAELKKSMDAKKANILFKKYMCAFPASYRDLFSAHQAIADIHCLESLSDPDQIEMALYQPDRSDPNQVRFKVYRFDAMMPLSDTVPMLENMGLRVLSEESFAIALPNKKKAWINEFVMTYAEGESLNVSAVRYDFQQAFKKIWLGETENDAFNRLVLKADLNWRQISVLRSYAKYFRQIGLVFTEEYVAATLLKNVNISQLLLAYFYEKFNPAHDGKTSGLALTLKKIELALESVATLNEDRVFRRVLNLMDATLRTNYFQKDPNGDPLAYLSLKFDPKKIIGLVLPLPKYEIFVCAPRFEGVHLRYARVARGGIRWSDRLEDYRTEILGLMKAQQVKNALIVPAGAKGGFVTKNIKEGMSREKILQEGIYCYQNFIRGLLDVTDNRISGQVVKHENTRCYDEEDPYIVVAADKGTATFSDIANRIAEQRGYWLGDGFASGGSTGYDHKKMAITARGAWVSAERHFLDLGIHLSHDGVSVIGIGDMSGDVFGNGLLRSPHIRLVAAFNHAHIFLDPNPCPKTSFAERQRLFQLPRSSWVDYDPALLSEGGGVYSRSCKSIELSDSVRACLGVEATVLEPNEVIKAILQAPVDLLWNGGIGTYVKSSSETDQEAGDRSNDAVRINGNQLRARIVCEGGNLGFTQRGRVEYEHAGGRVNADFIDNSAGVDCSDHEVNIKILLNEMVAAQKMTVDERNQLLSGMTDEVAHLVLRHNYLQNRAISLSAYHSLQSAGLLMRFIREKESLQKINRRLEFLPSDDVIMERKSTGRGFARPEIAVLVSYSKNILTDEIVDSQLVHDPYMQSFIMRAFPKVLQERYPKAIRSHFLARDILATQLSNLVISDMGVGFVFQMRDEMNASVDAIVRAFIVARTIFSFDQYNCAIEALDHQLDPQLQYAMMYEGVRLVRRSVRWLLRNRRETIDIEKNIIDFSSSIEQIQQRLSKIILGTSKERFLAHVASLQAQKVPESVAFQVASAARIYHAMNIIEASEGRNEEVVRVAKIYFVLVERLDLLWFRDQINASQVNDRWTSLAKAAYKCDLDRVQRKLTAKVLCYDQRSIPGKINAWIADNIQRIERWRSVVAEMRRCEQIDFAILFVAMRELFDLAELS